MTWLLDADVLSQPAKHNGDAGVVAWLEAHQNDCYISSIVIAQLAFWVRTRKGKAREALQSWLTRLTDAMQGRILGFNVSTAHVWADLQYELQCAGRRMPVEDSYIAAIARRYRLTIVTGNTQDFRGSGVKTFNPFAERD